MPTPKDGETQDDFISRCISQLMGEEGVPQKEAVGRCYGIWDGAKMGDKMLISLNTPKDFWNKLNEEFEFTLDAAADEDNHLCEQFFSESNSAFDNKWTGKIWCSPPWIPDNIDLWVAKAVMEIQGGNAETVVMFLPNRPTAKWWPFVMKYANEIRVVKEELKWEVPDDQPLTVEPQMIAIFRDAVANAEIVDLTGEDDEEQEPAIKSDEEIEFDIDAPCGAKTIKIVGERRIGAYATIWGELDCDKERMTRKAIENQFPLKHTPMMMWKHGLDKRFGATAVGEWDVKSFKLDDLGLYVEGDITDNNAWDILGKTGGIGLSVGTVWYLVKRSKAADGSVNIDDWPLLDISIMEGGKQCVPSAVRKIKDAILIDAYKSQAEAFELEWDVSWYQQPGFEIQRHARWQWIKDIRKKLLSK